MNRFTSVEFIHVHRAKRDPDYALKIIDRIILQHSEGALHPEYVAYLVDILKAFKEGSSFKKALHLDQKRGKKKTQPEDLEAQVACFVRFSVRDKGYKLKHAIEDAAECFGKPKKWVGMTYSKWIKIKTPEDESHLDAILDKWDSGETEAKYMAYHKR
jgi:hypothetical protein